MKYERFEDLPVWQTAIEMGVKVYRLTEDRFFYQPGDLQGQLRRSSLSVSQNIAEGFERARQRNCWRFSILRGAPRERRARHCISRRGSRRRGI
jgi:four helix bundle protein